MTKREAELAIKSINRIYRALPKESKKKYNLDHSYLHALIVPYKYFKPLDNNEITVTAKKLLKEYLKAPYSLEELILGGRNKEYVDSRFLLWYFLFYYFFFNYYEIGELFGKNYVTVYYGINKISDYYKYNKEMKSTIDKISEKLNKKWFKDEKSNS